MRRRRRPSTRPGRASRRSRSGVGRVYAVDVSDSTEATAAGCTGGPARAEPMLSCAHANCPPTNVAITCRVSERRTMSAADRGRGIGSVSPPRCQGHRAVSWDSRAPTVRANV